MPVPIPINIVCEDLLSEAVIRKVLVQVGVPYAVGRVFGLSGAGYIKKGINGFNSAARGTPFLVLIDLNSCRCAPELRLEMLPRGSNANLIFRIAVREIEAWVLCDRAAVSRYLGVGMNQIPSNPDGLADPKKKLIELARGSRYRNIRDAIVPRHRSISSQGPGYNVFLCDFVREKWDLNRAIRFSDSLSRARTSLLAFSPSWMLNSGS